MATTTSEHVVRTNGHGSSVVPELVPGYQLPRIATREKEEPAFQTCVRLFRPVGDVHLQLLSMKYEHVKELMQNGYVVIDGFISREIAEIARREAITLRKNGELKNSAVLDRREHNSKDAREYAVAFLGAQMATEPLKPLERAFARLQHDLSLIVNLSADAEYQIANHPATGATFVRHRDALPHDGSNPDLRHVKRNVTAVVCLNPEWIEGDGGMLRIWPPEGSGYEPVGQHSPTVTNQNGSPISRRCSEEMSPRNGIKWAKDGDSTVLDIAPVGGRCVLFLSGAVEHAVTPTHFDRFAITAWYA